jgi:IclR family transcriptional regulator, pca regulon regulatory protein
MSPRHKNLSTASQFGVLDPLARSPRYSQSLELGLAILKRFRAEEPLRGIAEIASELGFSRSTTFRYMATLREMGYLEHGPARKYQLAPHAGHLGASALYATGLRIPARPVLLALRQDTGGMPTGLGILDDTDVIYLEYLPSLRYGHIDQLAPQGPGTRHPVHTTAVGKSILAHLPQPTLQTLLTKIHFPIPPSRLKKGQPPQPGPTHLRQALEAELEQIRKEDGIVRQPHPNTRDLTSIACPIHTILPNSRPLTLAIDLTVSRQHDTRQHVPTLQAAATQLTAALEQLELDPHRGWA